MIRSISGCGLIVLASCAAAFAQKTEGPTFEVASIKQSAPMSGGRIRIGIGGGPGTPDPGQVTSNNASLRDLMTQAYGVKGYQVSGPDWIDSQRFDIIAKVPAGATKEDLKVMWQNLLRERFGMEMHHETRQMNIYGLVVGKNGSKMKEAADDPPPTDATGPSAAGPDGPPLPSGPPKIGKDGMPEMPKGLPRGGMTMMFVNGRMRLSAGKVTMANLTNMLSNQFDRPVVDETGLTKNYEIQLDFMPEGGGLMMKGMMMAGGGAGVMAHGGGPEGAAPPDTTEAPTLAVALQEQLGLKLEPKKGPVDMVVVDHLEKMPTEN